MSRLDKAKYWASIVRDAILGLILVVALFYWAAAGCVLAYGAAACH